VPTRLAGGPLLHALALLAASLLATPCLPLQRWNIDTLMRRLSLLVALLDFTFLHLEEEGDAAFSVAANLCLRELYVVLLDADLLVSYVASTDHTWMLLCTASPSTSFHAPPLAGETSARERRCAVEISARMGTIEPRLRMGGPYGYSILVATVVF
jgi:hypothetical protein